MSIKWMVLTGTAFLLTNALALAQHEGHQMPAQSAGQMQTDPRALAPVSEIERLNLLIESARQTNDPARMRAAIDDLQNSLAAIRAHLLAAARASAETDHSQMNMEGMDHSKMNMPGMKPPPKGPSASNPSSEKKADHTDMNEMDHSKMNMPGMSPPPKSPPTSGATKSTESQKDHSQMEMPGMSPPKKSEPTSGSATKADVGHPATAAETKDPVCFMQVGTSAHKATYQGKTYYLCTKADREKFLADPEKYVKR